MRIGPDGMMRLPTRVIGCLRPGFPRVHIGPGIGLLDGGVPTEIPVGLVPGDLRMPNSEFTVVLKPDHRGVITVER